MPPSKMTSTLDSNDDDEDDDDEMKLLVYKKANF